MAVISLCAAAMAASRATAKVATATLSGAEAMLTDKELAAAGAGPVELARSSWRFRSKEARTRDRATASCCLISRSAAVMDGSLATAKLSGAEATVSDRLLAARRTVPTTVFRCCTVSSAENTSSENRAARAVWAVETIPACGPTLSDGGGCLLFGPLEVLRA